MTRKHRFGRNADEEPRKQGLDLLQDETAADPAGGGTPAADEADAGSAEATGTSTLESEDGAPGSAEAEETDGGGDPEEAAAESAAQEREAPARRGRSQDASDSGNGPRGVSGQPATGLGWLLLVASLAAALAPLALGTAGTRVVEVLQGLGLGSGLLALGGTLLLFLGCQKRRQETALAELRAALGEQSERHGQSAADLQYLVQAQRTSLDRPPASGEELDRVLLALNRQDEKVNNLTKAVKAFGKPLIEITAKVNEATAQLAEQPARLESAGKAIAEAARRTEEVVQQQTQGLAQQLGEIAGSNKPMAQAVANLRDELQQLATKLSGTLLQEVRKDVSALPGTVRSELESTLHTGLQQHAGQIQKAIAAVQGELGTALQRELGAAQSQILQQLQRELARVAQAAPRSHGPAPTPAPVAAATSAAPAAHEPAPAAHHGPSESAGAGLGGVAQSIAGSTKVSGGKFAEALAKAKKLKQ
ncbi:MAG: hypothetical protein IT458_17280 [Planctomycetes bacterium]|nr:hypothetical protein [Planctomycetota bacterium]